MARRLALVLVAGLVLASPAAGDDNEAQRRPGAPRRDARQGVAADDPDLGRHLADPFSRAQGRRRVAEALRSSNVILRCTSGGSTGSTSCSTSRRSASNFLETPVRKRVTPAQLAHDRHLRDARPDAGRGDPRVEVVPGRARPDSLPRSDRATGQTHRRRSRRRSQRGPPGPRAHEDDPHSRAFGDAGRRGPHPAAA